MKNIISILVVSILLVTCQSKLHLSHNDDKKYSNIYAFVGKKISVEKFDPNVNNGTEKKIIDEETGDSITIVDRSVIMDNAFRCKYILVKKLFNKLPNDTIEFIAYDHYGDPLFSENDSVILYISKSKNKDYYFHQKYHYDKVFKDKQGNYFSYLKFNDEEDVQYAVKNVKGFDTHFENEKFDIKKLNPEVINVYYPKEFYKIENNFAIPTKGIYMDELINYRINTSFKDL